MPNYTFFNEETGMEWDEFLSMADRDTYISTHPQSKTSIQCHEHRWWCWWY